VSGSDGGVLEEEWRRGRRPPASGGRWRGTRAQRSRVALRMPQVVVRLTGKARGRAGVWGRVWYISHEGELALEREDGTTVQGRAELERLVEDWSAHFRSRANGRDTVQLSFSVPESEVNGSPEARARVLAAVRATARAEWGSTHPYVLGSHTNSDNFHVHVIVRSRGYGGEILPTQKADLERWRVRFAAAAREQGLWVDASPRPARGQTARSVPTSVHRKQERGEALRPGSVPSASEAAAWEQALRKRNASERREYVERARETVRAAAAAADPSERRTLLHLAVELGQYAVDLPFEAPRSERERAPVQCGAQRSGRAEIASAVAVLAGAGGVAVASDLHGWV
jgi:hypothetical protein